MRNRATLFSRGVLLATVVTTGALMMPAPASAQTACPPTINACGCTIIAPGSYKLGLNIDSAQGLTPTGACIEIAASFVFPPARKRSQVPAEIRLQELESGFTIHSAQSSSKGVARQ